MITLLYDMPSIVLPSKPSPETVPFDNEKLDTPLPPDATSLAWVSSMSEHVLGHLDDLSAVDCQGLWDLGKRLKSSSHNDPIKQAMRVIIYHCRGSIYFYEKNWIRTIQVCRKCVAIPGDSLLQAHAAAMLEQSLVRMQGRKTKGVLICALCSAEKRAMPVCAQCKAQPYCSVKCLKSDQARHANQCHFITK